MQAGDGAGETPEAKAARERLTGLFVLAAVALGVAAGIATGDIGLGVGAFIAGCLVGGMYLQRARPAPDAGLPPRWGMVLSFVTGPLVTVAGIVELADGRPLVGGIRVVCGLVSIAFALDQRAVRRARSAALRADVRAAAALPPVVVGQGWSRSAPDVSR